MPLVLGIDAAWTERGSSGIALLDSADHRVIACAPSYSSFVAFARGTPISWGSPTSGPLKVSDVLDAASELAKGRVELVAIDMPISTKAFSSRRVADQGISKAFGSAWAATHSPNADRPGDYGYRITKQFNDAGYSVTTTRHISQRFPLIEVYPLAALVRLLNVPRRPLYKVSKCRHEWPEREARKANLLKVWRRILACLQIHIDYPTFPLPEAGKINTLSALKPYEDALDAIISAYVGALFLHGSAEAYGDSDAAIWVPKDSLNPSADRDSYLEAIQEALPAEWRSPSDVTTSRIV